MMNILIQINGRGKFITLANSLDTNFLDIIEDIF